MSQRTVKCVKLGRELPGLEEPPWRMLINEYRLAPATKEAQEFIAQQMERFFFGEGTAPPPGYVPPQR
jgi:Fe-S cluster biosynthesis and repair protein YggX